MLNLNLPASPDRPLSPRSLRRDLAELAIGYTLILLVIWTPRPYQRVLYLLAALFLAVVVWRSFHSFAAMGLRTTNLWRSLWSFGLALVLAAAVLLVSAHLHALHPVGGPAEFLRRYWGYALWAFVQQILLQDFFLRRFLAILPHRPRVAALAAATIFAAAHLPNPVLTPVTFVWGLLACLLFLHYRNLIPLALTHALFGIVLATAIPGPVIRNMRVGLGYLTYPATHGHPQRRNAPHTVSTQAWVSADAPTRRS